MSDNRQKPRLRKSRKLHLGHIAFMRAVVQGLDTYESWNRYLRLEGEHQDRKLVNRTVQWIRDEFAAAAKRHARPGTARLVGIDAQKSETRQAKIPTLEEFANDNDLADFSEAEQLEHFIARYGRQSTRQTRRSQLIAKQLAALDWLERLVVEPPKADDLIDAWLHPDLAAHLKSVDIRTLKQLADRINGLGHHWSNGVPAIGKNKADRIVDWLNLHATSTGLSIGKHVGIPRKRLDRHSLAGIVAPTTAVVPLDKLIIPAELDGSEGDCRLPQAQCRMAAQNDRDAIACWVRSKSRHEVGPRALSEESEAVDTPISILLSRPMTNTQRAYWKEAERFMLWAVLVRKRALSSMNPQDCEAYVAFLANPVPLRQWCGPRSRERWSPLWRPFEGPLSQSACRQAVVILKNLYRYMEENRYLANNPWHDIRLPKNEIAVVKSRSFTTAQWAFLEQRLHELPDTSAHRRLRVALYLFYETGMPLKEALDARVGHLRVVAQGSANQVDAYSPAASRAEHHLEGVRDVIAISSRLGEELSGYLVSRGFHPDLAHPSNRHVHVLGKATDIIKRAPWSPERLRRPDPAAGISANTLYLQVKTFLKNCAQAIAPMDPDTAKQFTAASSHWLRRTQAAQHPKGQEREAID
ncbi:phage integrase family protein [Noviherbaspirillum sp. CPCC 100848]|uniref:Phage integrase family protein n=1 Tax=Noviherbaspirillum album TaxID=3080276 RepID=A0ABU6JKL5_9BURK|nr:phage integrase family protein [Noviherbaspirillum sp. CPCC 100848]MEC4723719.1 phage integrase family protein [Noviherbaspirillum sp. CPCC 100848]